MNNIKEIELVKVDVATVKSNLELILQEIQSTQDKSQFKELLAKYTDTLYSFYNYASLSSFRYYGNTKDLSAKDFNDFYLAEKPQMASYANKIYLAIKASHFYDKIEDIFGINYKWEVDSNLIEYTAEAERLMGEEFKISNEIATFTSQGKANYRGEEMSITNLTALTTHEDRSIRKDSQDAIASFYDSNGAFYFENYKKLVKLRNAFARELGYPNYKEYSLKKWNRIGYNYNDLADYRNNVSTYFAPFYNKVNELKKKNLSVEKLTYYDHVLFADGPAKLLELNNDKTIEKYKKVANAINPAWGKVYSQMLENNSIDYEDRENKVSKGYATFIFDTPIIYSVFQKKDSDFRVLAHEFGHTLQFFLSWIKTPNYKFQECTLDTVEIFSHTMEMLAYPFLQDVFGAESQKYKISNFINHFTLMASVSMFDEFQEKLYVMEDFSESDVDALFLSLQKKYNFLLDTTENPFFASGKTWKRMDHLYHSPFYMIDYGLAVVVAAQLYQMYKTDAQKAIAQFENLAENLSILNQDFLKKHPILKSPFDAENMQQLAHFASQELDNLIAGKS
jgi:M3 family oligoendopeptidase